MLEQTVRTAIHSRLRPLLSEAHSALAETLVALDRRERALEQLEKASELAAEFDGRRLVAQSERLVSEYTDR